MEKLRFNMSINASREKVWQILWGDDSYPLWTAVFGEGSRVETDWKKGSRAVFVNVENKGMVSRIAENKPAEFMSIQHLGMIDNGVEDLDSEETRSWSGAFENYSLKSENGHTDLSVEMDVTDEMKEYFNAKWPLALEALKDLSENK